MRPVLFEIDLSGFSLQVYSYIFFSILAVVLVSVSMFFMFRNNRLSRALSIAGTALIVFFTVAGARSAGILYKYPWYTGSPGKFTALKYGDFSLLGGLILAVLSGYVFVKLAGRDILKIADSLVFPVGMGIILWRTGCFLNGCCSGRNTGSLFGVCFGDQAAPVHPTQLYEIASIMIILLILLPLRHKAKRPGILSLSFFSSFTLMYLVISIFREHTSYGIVLSLILSALLMVLIIIIGTTEYRKDAGKRYKNY